ncbi:hypothetical protein BpHYR1_038740 [Brachionus plicatilis]|uniref:RNA-directed DNA polymerase from mobile element jockey-like n=1 Tax=Brachionus plicatilis TaxID=10195 RepID=A0A3M7RKN6_BRAPC|nr:hypothetical protein BpHYR1_038740 [Brachionus plicatilis]
MILVEFKEESSKQTHQESNGNPTKFLNFFYTNAISLANKWSDFNSLSAFHKSPHVILITEFNALSNCKLDNYKLYCKNREMARGGIGVAIYFLDTQVKNFLTQHVLYPTLGTSWISWSRAILPETACTQHLPGITNSALAVIPLVSPRPVLRHGNYELFSTLVYDSTIPIDKDVNVAYDWIIKSYAAASSMAIPNQMPRIRKPKVFNPKIKLLTSMKYKIYCRPPPSANVQTHQRHQRSELGEPPGSRKFTILTRTRQRANTFTNKIVNEWNALPATVIDADSVNKFKNRYDIYNVPVQSTIMNRNIYL